MSPMWPILCQVWCKTLTQSQIKPAMSILSEHKIFCIMFWACISQTRPAFSLCCLAETRIWSHLVYIRSWTAQCHPWSYQRPSHVGIRAVWPGGKGIGDITEVGILSWYLTNNSGQLSLLPSVGWPCITDCVIYPFAGSVFPLPSNRHHRSNDDWRVRGKIVRSILFSIECYNCAQCNVHAWTDLTVVCWLDLAFLWLYCLLQFVRVRFSFLGLFCVIVHLCICAFVVLDFVSSVLCQEIG